MRTYLLLALLATGAASAADFSPNRSDDPAPGACSPEDCSLREAVIAANASPGADRIVLGKAVYLLTRPANGPFDELDGALWIQDDTEVVGLGATTTRVRWAAGVGANDSVFVVHNTSSAPLNARFRDLTISHGRGMSGGCVYMPKTFSTFTFERVLVERCASTTNGGALLVTQSTLNLHQVALLNNIAGLDGGALSLSFATTLNTFDSRMLNNAAVRDGGAVAFQQFTIVDASDATWSDDGRTVVAGNQAGRSGGGISANGDVSVEIRSPGSPADAMLTVRDNVAAADGGGLARLPGLINKSASLTLFGLRVFDNEAADGGGVSGQAPLVIDASELRHNSASTGTGGGLRLAGDGTARVTRSSFTSNSAATEGGGAYAGCQDLDLRNVSMQRNSAAEGQAIHAARGLLLRHVTLFRNSGGGVALMRRASEVCGVVDGFIGNSLIADHCAAPEGHFVSEGGNQFGVGAGGCPVGPQDMLQAASNVFDLSIKDFGAAFKVTGWPSDTHVRPQRGFGLAANCEPDDVRGQPRNDGACDAGAFEQQGPFEF